MRTTHFGRIIKKRERAKKNKQKNLLRNEPEFSNNKMKWHFIVVINFFAISLIVCNWIIGKSDISGQTFEKDNNVVVFFFFMLFINEIESL